jgi:RNA polymerase sigma-70 factor (ECF subfamily)
MPEIGDRCLPYPSDPSERFAQLYADHGPDLLVYALRRVERSEDAAEILAETFVVAWRRVGDVPDGREALLWLYGVARLILANHRRGELRRVRLTERLRTEVFATQPAFSGPDVERTALLEALKRLNPMDREVLLLAGWEELEPAEIARVLGISAVTSRGRLHRARRRLRKELARDEAGPATANFKSIRTEEAR